MTKYLFYLKECLFNPIVFFKHRKENPRIIQMPWVLIPIAVFMLFVFVHWASNTVTTKNIKLDFELYILIHVKHLFVGLFFTLFIWFRTWLTLKYIGKLQDSTSSTTAWCMTPYLLILPILFIVILPYMHFFIQEVKIPINQNVSIMSVQHGTSLIRAAVLFSDIWIIFLIFTAVTILNPIRSRASLTGAIIIFLLPSVLFMTFH